MKYLYVILISLGSFQYALSQNSLSDSLAESSKEKLKELKELLSPAYFGVPESPAFALLPDAPTKVSNLVTPKDFATFVPTNISNGVIKTGIGADFRLFTLVQDSTSSDLTLKKYWENPAIRPLWRSVVSIGTSAKEGSQDSYLALGIRIPLIDKGDPRSHESLIRAHEDAINKIISENRQPSVDDPDNEARNKKIDSLTTQYHKELKEKYWNAFKLDVGLGNLWQLESSSIKMDSIAQNRFGAWVAMSRNVFGSDQIILSANHSFLDTNNVDSLENSRSVVGLKYRYILRKVSLSVEGAKVWSGFEEVEGQETKDKSWLHGAALLEIKVPKLNGFIGLAYGGNTEDKSGQFQFKYAFYTDRIEKK